MSTPVSDLDEMIRRMAPTKATGVYVFATIPAGTDLAALDPVASVREQEGLTVVVEESKAKEAGLTPVFRAAWITLNVHSDLRATGLTAAFSAALALAGIGCNVFAGTYHDHVFVPHERADEAMTVLQELQRRDLPA